MSFIHFGCWNNGNCNISEPQNGLSHVMKKIKEFTKEKKINFAVIAGDNYYAAKEEKKDKSKEEKEKKIKLFNKANFDSGVECLKNSLPGIKKYVLLGNHEFDKLTYISEDEEKCNLMRLQQKTFKTEDNFIFFKDVMTEKSEKTLIIMIDTTLYEYKNDIKKKYCDEVFPIITNRTYENLIRHQEDVINGILIGNKDKKNIIIIGHHPIFTLKGKEDKTKLEVLEGLAELFQNISSKLTGKNIYYLCADNHLQQEGIITINDDLKINQYVSGTGGAELDKCNKPTETNKFEVGNVSYDVKMCNSRNGFYYIDEKGDDLIFEFIEANPITELKGGYKEKYLKYKAKYLNLKKNLN